MSRLYSSFRRTVENTGVSACLISFLCFVIMWVLGYVSGVILVMLGLRDKLLESVMDEEVAEMVARMNEEGPNN